MKWLIPAWENGALKPLDKVDVHRRGLRHKAISIFVTDGDRVLLQKRAAVKYHTPGLWTNTCCTHPHWGEDDMDCAERRLFEEMGIRDLPLQHVGQIEYRADVGDGMIEHEVVQVYRARATGDLPMKLNPREVQDATWVSLPVLASAIERTPARFTPWLQIYMREHTGMIFPELAATGPVA
ncbi:MAG: isopentenyl-diphosphate Delta-isomerase [Rhodobacteraceae bacterium]|nr:isopentenyl-diphosphate Delta-isomerase [Paracoccaceae bacterium]